MFKKPAIIFDLDDTLIYTHEVYLAITCLLYTSCANVLK